MEEAQEATEAQMSALEEVVNIWAVRKEEALRREKRKGKAVSDALASELL